MRVPKAQSQVPSRDRGQFPGRNRRRGFQPFERKSQDVLGRSCSQERRQGHGRRVWHASDDIVGGKTLLDILQQEQFTFIVSEPHPLLQNKVDVTSLPASFDFGYGDIHSWDMERYMQQLSEIKGGQIEASWNHYTDDSYVASVTQSVVQDIMWLHRSKNMRF